MAAWIMAILAALGTPATPSTPATPTRCHIGTMLELPITMEKRKPIATIGVNGHDERFIVDAGAYHSLISSAGAAQLGLKLYPAPPGYQQIEGIGGASDVEATRVSLTLGKTTIPDVEFIVGSRGFGAVGLLGQNVLGKADVEYDLAGDMIRLLRPHDCNNANLAYWADGKAVSILDIERASDAGEIAGFVTVNGVRLHAAFDTGAGRTIMTLRAAKRAGVSIDSPGVMPDHDVRGLGKDSMQTWSGRFQTVKIGDEEIRNVRLRFGDFGDADDSDDILIGADFFLSHHVYVANGLHKMFFTYNGGAVFGAADQTGAGASEP